MTDNKKLRIFKFRIDPEFLYQGVTVKVIARTKEEGEKILEGIYDWEWVKDGDFDAWGDAKFLEDLGKVENDSKLGDYAELDWRTRKWEWIKKFGKIVD